MKTVLSFAQLRQWQWTLDNHLPPPFDSIAEWLVTAENLLRDDDEIPSVMNEDTANLINKKLEEHKVSTIRTLTEGNFVSLL